MNLLDNMEWGREADGIPSAGEGASWNTLLSAIFLAEDRDRESVDLVNGLDKGSRGRKTISWGDLVFLEKEGMGYVVDS